MSATPTVLIADDDRAIRTVLSTAFTRAGYGVRAGETAASLWRWVEDGEGDLVVLDVLLPDENGLDLIPRIKRLRPDLHVIAMSARTTLATAVRAAAEGAFDYLPKPFDLDALVLLAERALARPVAPAPEAVVGEQSPMVGQSHAMQELYRGIARLAVTDLTVMIAGESGTGKELVARALHAYGKRRAGPFVPLNMAAIPRELVESELFGHERGAYTGALTRSPGRFQQADGGTLFLDEIGDMPPDAQIRLLRVLQEREVLPIGGHVAIPIDVRIIAATHRDLQSLIDRNVFREDLFYRLNVAPLRVPPLRERIADVPLLAQHFLARAKDQGLPEKRFTPDAVEELTRYRWPGNVRELENLVRRLVVLSPGDAIDREMIAAALDPVGPNDAVAKAEGGGAGLTRELARHFQALIAGGNEGTIYHRALAEFERPLIEAALRATRGNQIRAATLLGLNRNTLRKKIRDLAIPIVRGHRVTRAR